MFFSSHVLSEVEMLCDRVAIIRLGQIVDEGLVSISADATRSGVTLQLAGDDRPIAIAGATVVARHGPPSFSTTSARRAI